MHLGIDFGSQLKGTTAICYQDAGRLSVIQSAVNQAADPFILDVVERLGPTAVFIDAPLSLPSAYFQKDHDDFMYREADRQLAAMSPMFLGGLTARSMRLKRILYCKDIDCHETYPKATLNLLFSDVPARKDGSTELLKWAGRLARALPCPIDAYPESWHQFDAMVCWLSGYRFKLGIHATYGNEDEGHIIV